MKAASLVLAMTASAVAASGDGMTLSATSVNVAESGVPVTIKLQRWSTDEERGPIVSALNPASRTAAAPAPDTADAGGTRGARGGARGRGGRGRGPAAPLSPIAAFTAALSRAPTIGYVWTGDITGYAIKYAWHATLADRSERIVLASNRRLGAYTNAWKTTAAVAENDYAFTLIELRLGWNGSLEGRTSLTGKIGVDTEAKTVALESYNTIPIVLMKTAR